MRKKNYIPPTAIVIHLELENHILTGSNGTPTIGFSSDESVGITSEQNIFGRKQVPASGRKESIWD